MGRQLSIIVMALGWLSPLAWCGCVVSPQPEPPTIDAERVWIELISTNPDNPDERPDTAIIHGDSGAVTPGGALLRVVNLDGLETPREVIVEEDGGFSVALGGQPGHIFRLRAFASDLWSRPVDVVAPEETGPAEPAPTPLRDCFLVRSPAQVHLGNVPIGDIGVEVISIENDCDEPAIIEDIRLRIGDTQPPSCEEDLQMCRGGEVEERPGESVCYEPYALCLDECSREHLECLEIEPPEVCDASYAQCQEERCLPDLRFCCDAQFQQCQEVPYESPQGFTVLYGGLPMTVPSGSSRTIVVTFAPLWTGTAEDALIIDVGLPQRERRTITLTGVGVGG